MKNSMRILVTAIALASGLLSGCAVQRGQETMGAYVDDATITTQVKSRFVESKEVDAGAISVETMKGTVMLSGFAKSVLEKNTAERIARGVSGVRAVKNEVSVRP
ncbi:osmotically-inducible protein Y [Comamonadaceae bacterium OS-4]|nr:osmotically-inducible protein Y [Comamonadaceae bacterium OS-4]